MSYFYDTKTIFLRHANGHLYDSVASLNALPFNWCPLKGARGARCRLDNSKQCPDVSGDNPGGDKAVRVLIADDSALIRKRLDAMLLPHSHIEVVGLAEDAVTAMEHIHRLLPHAIILDWHMPGGGGLQVLKELQSESCKPLVIVLTNYADEAYRTRAMAAGAHYFLDKSTEFSQVQDLLMTLMDTTPPVVV